MEIKKLFVLSVVLIVVFAPSLLLAQIAVGGRTPPEPPCCCKLKYDIEVNVTTFGPTSGTALVGKPGGADCCKLGTLSSAGETPHWAGLCALNGVMTFATVIMWIGMIVVGIALVFAGIIFVTAAGDPDRVKKAKQIFLWSLVGVLVAVLAKFIPAVARYFIGI